MDNLTGDAISLEYTRESIATKFNEDLDIEVVEANIPRIDFANYSKDVKILIEKESTNVLPRSDFSVNNGGDAINWNFSYNYTTYSFENSVSAYTIVSALSATRIERSANFLTKGVNYQLSLMTDAKQLYYRNFVNVTPQVDKLYDDLAGWNILSTPSFKLVDSIICKLRPYLDMGYEVGDIVRIRYGQIETNEKNETTSFIPTGDTPVTRAKDSLTINLESDSKVYIKTVKEEKYLDKTAGIWNVENDIT